VRELENCIERAVIVSSDGVVHGFNLPPSLQTGNETRTSQIIGNDQRDQRIAKLAGSNQGNVGATRL
jgi:Nif-specific regulatory protein